MKEFLQNFRPLYRQTNPTIARINAYPRRKSSEQLNSLAPKRFQSLRNYMGGSFNTFNTPTSTQKKIF